LVSSGSFSSGLEAFNKKRQSILAQILLLPIDIMTLFGSGTKPQMSGN